MNPSTFPPLPGCAMVVVAAGRGRRFHQEFPKQYQEVLGHPLLVHTLLALHRHPQITCIQPVIAPDDVLYQECIVPHIKNLPKMLAPVAGGQERQESVLRGITALGLAANDWVGIHDGARPVVRQDMLDRLLAARQQASALIAAVPAHDTVKSADSAQYIQATLNRGAIWLAQTPQIFRYELIHSAHLAFQNSPQTATDDAALVERLGQPVLLVPGDPANIKVTRPEDLDLAAWYLSRM